MPHRVGIKFCGLKDDTAIEMANKLGIHLAGFVHFAKSPRHVEPAHAKALADQLHEDILSVSVMVNPDDDALEAYLNEFHPEFIQLHGLESPARAQEIKTRFGVRIIKAIAVAEASDLWAVNDYRDVADLILLDAKAPKGANLPGGRGESFDWSLLHGVKLPDNWILSGGLHEGNVLEAIRATHAPQIDVSSGIESAPGIKDPQKMAAFTHKIAQL